MKINALSAIQKYAASRPATEPEPKSDFSTPLARIPLDFAQTLAKTELTVERAMVGETDPHTLVQALAQTELAVEAAVSVRNKVIEAYQEILRMPV